MADSTIPVLPPEEAIAFFRTKGLARSFAWQDIWTAQHDFFFTVAKMLSVSLLEDVHGEILAALQDGRSPQQLAKDLKSLLAQRGWWGKALQKDPLDGETKLVQLGSNRRVRTIVNTNLRTSYAAGRWERIDRVKSAFPILVYKSRMDGHERDQHRAWHNTALPVGDDWWTTHYPPCDWGCRCRTVSMTAKMAERRGLDPTAKPAYFGKRRWVNKRTGEVMQIEKGIGAGWDYHPGRAKLEGMTPDPLFGFSQGDGDAIAAALKPAIARFLDRFGADQDGRVWRDAAGWPIAITPRWLRGLTAPQQELAAAASAAIAAPVEIRLLWVTGKDGRGMLVRRYIDAGFVVDIGAAFWRFSAVAAKQLAKLRTGASVWRMENTATAIAAYNPSQPRDARGRWRGSVGSFVISAFGDPASQAMHSLGPIGGNAPADVHGFDRLLPAETIRKVMRKHGAGGHGGDRHPVAASDFALIGAITAHGRWTEKIGKSGRRTVEYSHVIDGRRLLYVEVVGAKRKRAIAKSLYVPNE